MIEALRDQIPVQLRARSGAVFYSGRKAFSRRAGVYLLGINPGGDPATHETDTVEAQAEEVLKHKPDDWSAYRDDTWQGLGAGKAKLQVRVLHLLAGLGMNPGHVPSSNVVFVRSRRLKNIDQDFDALADSCWPFHSAVLEKLEPRVILCFGGRAGSYVRRRVGAYIPVDEMKEENNRGWRSRVFANSHGLKVVALTHPSVANWKAQGTDPTWLVRRALDLARVVS